MLQVCEYEAQLSSVKEAQAAAKAAAGDNQDLEQEVQEAFEEMNTQRAIYDKYVPQPRVSRMVRMSLFPLCQEALARLANVRCRDGPPMPMLCCSEHHGRRRWVSKDLNSECQA